MALASCDIGRLQPEGRPVTEVWGAGTSRVEVASEASPLYAELQVPILSAPEVFAVYVPSHVDRARDVMIGEHWVFFKLRDGDWIAERGLEAEPVATGDASPESQVPLRSVEGWSQAVVPWKDKP